MASPKRLTSLLIAILAFGLVLAFGDIVPLGTEGLEVSKRSFSLSCSLSTTSEPPETKWNRTYTGPGVFVDEAHSVVQTSDNGYVIAGSCFASLVKTDTVGNIQWSKIYKNEDGVMLYGKSVIATSDGYVIAGSEYANLVKVDFDGNEAWAKLYRSYNLVLYSVIQTSDGGYAAAGRKDNYFWLVKTDSLGNMEWNQTYGGDSFNGGFSVIETSDHGYAIAGWSGPSSSGNYHFRLVKTDSSGNTMWGRTYGGGQAYSLLQTFDGGYVMAGAGYANLVKVDANGNVEWDESYGGSAYSITRTFDGGYALAGVRNYGMWLARTDSSGSLHWDVTYQGPVGSDHAWAVVQTNDGGYMMVGDSMRLFNGLYPNLDWWIIKLGPDGGINQEIALVKRYFPVYMFSASEEWFPCSFYFDGNGLNYPWDLYNEESYSAYTPFPPPYYAYVHISENATHMAIQYWLYYVFNLHWFWTPAHWSDWDSTVFVILDKTGSEPVPVDVYYFFHHAKEHYSWDNWDTLGEKEGSHVVVYVAEGSHGAYSYREEMNDNPHNAGIDDRWQSGGAILREQDFNWYLVGNSAGYGYSDNYCDMSIEWINGGPQWEFDSYWWPRKFPQYQPNMGPMPAPWERSEWNLVQPISSRLLIHGFSPINLLVTDPSGLKAGYDRQSEQKICEIPGALYSGPNAEPEFVLIPDPVYGDYMTEVFGTESGTYDLSISRLVADVEVYHEEQNDVAIEQNETHSTTTLVFSHSDISVVSMENSKTVIGQGYLMGIDVTIENHGVFTENFNLSVCANSTAIQCQNITLESGSSTTVQLTWNTTDIQYGNYTIIAYAWPVLGETYKVDNTITAGWVVVTVPGDVNGDKTVDNLDLVNIGEAYGSRLEDQDWDTDADVNCDEIVNIRDLRICGRSYG